MKKKYQVFLSSTYLDLIAERNTVLQALLETDFIPCGMELFPAADDNQLTVIKKFIDDCDYYIVIVAGKYGSLGPGGKSYTQIEYEYAVEKQKPVLAFLHVDPDQLPQDRCEKNEERRAKLAQFRGLCEQRMCKYWRNADHLVSIVYASLDRLKESRPAIGWVRADSPRERVDAKDFFYTLDERLDSSFSACLRDAKRVSVLARTAVNLLSEYERQITDKISQGCDFRFLYISRSSEGARYAYGGTPGIFEENTRKMAFHLRRLSGVSAKRVAARELNYLPTFSIMWIERNVSNEDFLVVQLYFLHSRFGRDRPLFRVERNDKWFTAFTEEFEHLWDGASDCQIL